MQYRADVSRAGEQDGELERLQRVYDEYERDTSVSAKWSSLNPGNRAMIAERDDAIRDLLEAHGRWPLGDTVVVDVGCGSGGFLRRLEAWGARPERLAGVDVYAPYLEAARARQPHVSFLQGSADDLPFETGSVDLVSVFTVFSSILDRALADAVAQSITRVLRPGGGVLWYDFRVPSPLNRANVRSIRRAEIARLFPGFGADLRRITLIPQLARRLGRLTRVAYRPLALPWPMRTHYVGLLTKP
jgi:ubiquinone/menaquinone biosynthesis C-methylase UbiE